MVITNKTEAGRGLKPEFIKKVVAKGYVKTRRGYEYYYRANLDVVFRKEPLTNKIEKICNIEVA